MTVMIPLILLHVIILSSHTVVLKGNFGLGTDWPSHDQIYWSKQVLDITCRLFRLYQRNDGPLDPKPLLFKKQSLAGMSYAPSFTPVRASQALTTFSCNSTSFDAGSGSPMTFFGSKYVPVRL